MSCLDRISGQTTYVGRPELFVLYRRLAHPTARTRLTAYFDEIEKLIDEHGDQVDIDDPVKMKVGRR